MRLTKTLFGSEFNNTSNLFGLRCGQMRSHYSGKITHNSGWYNHLGEKLGFGDLGADDFKRLMAELEANETFILLSESDSFWRFVEKVGHIGAQATVSQTETHPGTVYVAQKALYIIKKGEAFLVSPYAKDFKNGFHERNGTTFKVITRAECKKMLGVTPEASDEDAF